MAKQPVQCKVDPEIRAKFNDYLSQTGRKESHVVEELVTQFVVDYFEASTSNKAQETFDEAIGDLQTAIHQLNARLERLHTTMRLDLGNFLKHLLVNADAVPRGPIGEAEINELLAKVFRETNRNA